MTTFNFNIQVVLVAMMVALMQFHGTAATQHVVGDALGWSIPANATYYSTWASYRNFTVGDVLVFNFDTGLHTLATVTPSAYANCNKNSPISLITSGPAKLTLTTAGVHSYICTVGSHCVIGQKLTINARP